MPHIERSIITYRSRHSLCATCPLAAPAKRRHVIAKPATRRLHVDNLIRRAFLFLLGILITFARFHQGISSL